jgi:hypothetical protein
MKTGKNALLQHPIFLVDQDPLFLHPLAKWFLNTCSNAKNLSTDKFMMKRIPPLYGPIADSFEF